MSYKHIKVDNDDKIKFITLNRPDKHNALNTKMYLELKKSLIKADENNEINVIVIRGEGNSFCSGADIKEFSDTNNNSESIENRASLAQEIHLLLRKINKPIIASVHKYVFAGGCGLALACDIVLAADNTEFAYPEIKRGFVPALVSPNLIRIAGPRKAFELLITGKKVKAEEALDMNLINRIEPIEELKNNTLVLAKQIANYSGSALKMTKNLFYNVSEMDFDKAMKLSKETNMQMRQTKDFKKGVEDFINRS